MQRVPSRIEFAADFLQASGPEFIGTLIRNWPRREIQDVMPNSQGIQLIRKGRMPG